MTLYLSLLVALVGVLVYALTNGKISEIGRICFWVGLLVFLFQTAPHTITTLR